MWKTIVNPEVFACWLVLNKPNTKEGCVKNGSLTHASYFWCTYHFLVFYFFLFVFVLFFLPNPSSERAFKEAGQPDRALHEWMALYLLKDKRTGTNYCADACCRGFCYSSSHSIYYIASDFLLYRAIFDIAYTACLDSTWTCAVQFGQNIYWSCHGHNKTTKITKDLSKSWF